MHPSRDIPAHRLRLAEAAAGETAKAKTPRGTNGRFVKRGPAPTAPAPNVVKRHRRRGG